MRTLAEFVKEVPVAGDGFLARGGQADECVGHFADSSVARGLYCYLLTCFRMERVRAMKTKKLGILATAMVDQLSHLPSLRTEM